MYRITRIEHKYIVTHHPTPDSKPTPTESSHSSRPEAWSNALGRAANMSILLNAAQIVETDDGHQYSVLTTRIP